MTMAIIVDSLSQSPYTAGYISRRLSKILNDEKLIRWTMPERIEWINDAVKAIMIRRPMACMRRDIISLDRGAAQRAPEHTVQINDIPANHGPNGTGRYVSLVDRRLLDAEEPEWRSMEPSGTVMHYMVDDIDPLRFYVYPPAIAGTLAVMVRNAVPLDISDESDEIPLGPEYLEAIIAFCVYRCHSKDSEYSQQGIGTAWYQTFLHSIGDTTTTQLQASPNTVGVTR